MVLFRGLSKIFLLSINEKKKFWTQIRKSEEFIYSNELMMRKRKISVSEGFYLFIYKKRNLSTCLLCTSLVLGLRFFFFFNRILLLVKKVVTNS